MLFFCQKKTIILLAVCSLFFSQALLAQNNDALKSGIYSKLKCCACQVSFDKCSCPEAREMKAYIDALLESGASKKEIFYKMVKKFSLDAISDTQTKRAVEKKLIKEAGEKRPQISFDSTAFNFGEVSKKQGQVSKVFKFSNNGNAPLIIKSLKTSCPCTSVSVKVNPVRDMLLQKAVVSNGANEVKSPYFSSEGSPADWQLEIKPQATAELELMVDLASVHVKLGKLVRDASVVSNDPVYSELTLKVEAEVKD